MNNTWLPLTGVPYTTQGGWLRGESMIWCFQRPTRVTGFEVRDGNAGVALSVKVGNLEQLAVGEIPIMALTYYPIEISLHTVLPGMDFIVLTRDFEGELRPLGAQAI